MPAPVLWGSPFQINTILTNDQYRPKIVALPNGTFVAVWTDSSGALPDQSGTAIHGQILNADGSKRGGEFIINTTHANNQETPAIAVLNDGRFVVAWTDRSGANGEPASGIRARIYSMNGDGIGDDFAIHEPRAGGQYSVSLSATANGGFVATYTDDATGSGTDRNILAQAYDANLSRLGAETYVNGTVAGNQEGSKVIGLKDGRYVVFYQDSSQSLDDPNAATIRGRIVNADGQPAEGTTEFVVPSSRGSKIDPNAVRLADGRFVVVWTHLNTNTGDGSGTAVKAQIYNADGTMSGGEFVVNTTTQDHQVSPLVTATIDGGFAVAFTHYPDNDATERHIRVATFTADGTRTGPDMLAAKMYNAVGAASPTAAMTTLADGRIALTWDGNGGPTGTNGDVWGQILDPRNSGISLIGTSGDDRYVGGRYSDYIHGAAGSDRIHGGAGNDKLYGGSGRDAFMFDTAPSSKSNKDLIKDWSYKDDTVYLENAIFKSLKKTGVLSKSSFVLGSAAKDKNDYVGYNSKTGDLWYDTNGSKSGGQVSFANIGKKQKIYHNDFFIF